MKGGIRMAVKDQARRDRIAAKLRGRRAEANLTQDQVADACGMERSSIGKYETGVSCMDYETAWDLADLYGVSLDELGGRKAPAPQGDAV